MSTKTKSKATKKTSVVNNAATPASVEVNKYSFLVGLEKTLLRVAVIVVPIIYNVLPAEWMNITLGGALIFLMNFIKNYDFGTKVRA